ncbi:MAG TPA: hypothetical protein VM734_26485 [Kofleriaceae bacterium]|nr:hypothetical protein [Kofleriaceae bacterium]
MDVAPDPVPTPVDLGRIRAIVARARTRIRLQGALEGATTASILASASALVSVFAVRLEVIAPATGLGLLAASGAVIAAGAALGAVRRLDDEDVARQVDRASGLADRLSTAIAFDRLLRSGGVAAAPGDATDGDADDDTRDLMRAAIRDAVQAAPRADVAAAAPYRRPRDLVTAVAFAVVAALAAGLAVPLPDRDPRLIALDPPAAKAGVEVTITGERLCGPDARPEEPCRLDGAMVYVGDGLEAASAPGGAVLGGSLAIVGVLAASDSAAVAASVTSWTGAAITFTVPAGARIGKTRVVVWARGKQLGALPFEVLRADDPRAMKENTVALDPDDEAYMRELVADLKAAGDKDDIKELSDYAAKIERLLDQAERGELTKEQLLEEMKKAEAALNERAEPDQAEISKDLAETGKELQKNELTKELGEALAKNDLEKAKQELEKLADKMEKGELTEQQQQQLAKTMEQVAQRYEQKQQQRQDQSKQALQQQEDAIRKLEKERDQAKTDEERQEAERRLEKKKQELQELKKKQDEKEQSAQRESLKRLHKDMDKAAKQLQQKDQDKSQQDQQQENQKQASRTLKDVADETGKVDQDQRKQAAQKKVSSQMDDLREAMRRAKQRGQRGPQNPFGKGNKGGKNQDFARRAGGGQGQKGAWKPGQGQGQGQGKQGQGQNGGQGNQPPNGPSDTYGDGHDPNLVGDPTGKSGNTKDEDVSGVHGKKGPSRRETILSAAQKGFASAKYREVYADYKQQVEEVMRSEKVPSSYKYYVKKYFTKIKPHSMD